MKLREVIVRNYRNLVDVRIPIDNTTVLVGENNTGKTAFLDALTQALPKTGYTRNNPFDEYDYHMAKKEDSPRNNSGIGTVREFRALPFFFCFKPTSKSC